MVELFETLDQAGNIEPIWEIIHQRVANELWDEYADAFKAPDGQFESLVENAKYISIPDLKMTELRKNAQHSQGKNEYSRNLLWASRQSSPAAQKKFDEELGVSVYQPAKK